MKTLKEFNVGDIVTIRDEKDIPLNVPFSFTPEMKKFCRRSAKIIDKEKLAPSLILYALSKANEYEADLYWEEWSWHAEMFVWEDEPRIDRGTMLNLFEDIIGENQQ